MIFHSTTLKGAWLIEPERRGDERGFFARCFCNQEFANRELETRFVQLNNSVSSRTGTLRGLHYQLPPSAEVKLVRCIHGSLYDVVVDLRPNSPTFLKWCGAELNADNRLMMYVPKGCAHGFLSLSDHCEALYLVSASYDPKQERGLRYDDSQLSIRWPLRPVEISTKDASWPDFDPSHHGCELMRDCQ